jgi:hypothetical protein
VPAGVKLPEDWSIGPLDILDRCAPEYPVKKGLTSSLHIALVCQRERLVHYVSVSYQLAKELELVFELEVAARGSET